MATVFAMSLLHRRALDRWEVCTEDEREEAERLVAIAKAWITWQARGVIVQSRERCGAQALLENNGMTELVTGIEGAITAEGDNIALYAKAAGDLLVTARPAPPAVPRDPAGTDLTDPRFLHGLLAHVEHIWFARAGERALRVCDGDRLARWNAASGPALRGSRRTRTGRPPRPTPRPAPHCPGAGPGPSGGAGAAVRDRVGGPQQR